MCLSGRKATKTGVTLVQNTVYFRVRDAMLRYDKVNKSMKKQNAHILLACMAIGASHVILFTSWIVPKFMRVVYRLKTETEVSAIMPRLTNLALNYTWIFPAMLVGICLLAAAAFAMRPDSVTHFTLLGLCMQGTIVWFAFFCFCFNAFTRGGSLHHQPFFDLATFCRFGAGVFRWCL